MTTALTIARGILDTYGSTTTMKLHKITYYAQALSIYKRGVPLFPEAAQALFSGPVYPSLFACHEGLVIIDAHVLPPATLTEDEQAIVTAVCDDLAPLTGDQLAKKTRSEPPYLRAGEPRDTFARIGEEITLEDMKEYFSTHSPLSCDR